MIIASLYPCPFDIQERHESNTSIIFDDKIYSYEESKLTTAKQDASTKFPERSLLFGCKQLGILPSKINKWVFPTPQKKISNLALRSFFSHFKIYFKSNKHFNNWKKKNVFFIKHHLMHSSLAVYSSNFKECAYITADGGGDLGDERHFVFGEYKNRKFNDLINYPGKASIASFHAYVSDALGMSGGENGKTSGLAAYGKINSELKKEFNKIIKIDKLNIKFERSRKKNSNFNFSKLKAQEYDRLKIIHTYPSMTNVFQISKKFLPQDIAATAESIVYEKFIKILIKAKMLTNKKNIVFSGGLFSNVTLNNKIIESNIFEKFHFNFAPTDAGLSLGGALYIKNKYKIQKRKSNLSPYLGPSFSDKEIEEILIKYNLKYSKINNIAREAAKLISKGKIVGFFQGRAEIGHRSLGNRSILANPREFKSKSIINQHLKKRDWFMPYAPSILSEDLIKYTSSKYSCSYMQVAYKIEKNLNHLKSAIHEDFSSRIHSVSKKMNPVFWNLIKEFKKITGVGAVLNTSFNRHGIATISSPRQAVEHLMEGCMDVLIISKFCLIANENRKFKSKFKSIVSEKKNLIELCNKRYKNVKSFLTKSERNYYKNNLKKIVRSKMNSIR